MPNDKNLDKIQDGQQARVIRAQNEDWLMDREEDILTDLCNRYRGDTLTNDLLRGSIGEIAGLRGYREHLEARIFAGVASAEKELGQDG